MLLYISFTSLVNVDNKKSEGEYIGIVTKSKENYYLFSSDLVKYYVYEKDNKFEVGDILKIHGKREILDFVSLESEFDFQDYLINQNVKYTISTINVEIISRTFIRTNSLKRYILSRFDEKSQRFVNNVIFNSYSQETANLGIGFIITNSGLLIYTLDTILKRVLRRFINEKIAIRIETLILFPLTIFSSFKVGVIKALIFVLIKNYKLDVSKSKIYNTLLLLCLFSNPLYFKTAEFYFSFLFPLFIPYLKEAINSFSFKYKEIINIFLIQLLFIPLQIYFSSSISIFSFIYVFLLKNVFGIIFLSTYVLLFLPFLNPLLLLLSDVFNALISALSLFNINFYYMNTVNLLIISSLFLVVLLIINFERNNKKRGIKYIISLSLMLYLNSTEINFATSFVAFINVGQGDCALVHDKNINVLIDTGGNIKKDIANDVLIPFFNKMRIKKINYIFLSHDDYDHSGALQSLVNNFKVDNYYFGSDFVAYKINNLVFENLNSFGDKSLSNNDSSLIKLKFYTRTYLFCGDISQNIEQKVIINYDVKADIIKIAHHGSNTSSSIEFLKAVSPKEAIISVGKNNLYKHPSQTVLKNLETLNIRCRRTDTEGTIIYKENNYSFLGMFFYFFEVKYEISYNDFGE